MLLLMHATSTELAGDYLKQRQKECAFKLAEEEAALRTSIEATHDAALKSLQRDIAREQVNHRLRQRETQTSAANTGPIAFQKCVIYSLYTIKIRGH